MSTAQFKPGDVVDHPVHGRGFVYKEASGWLYVTFGLGYAWPIQGIADDLTLVLSAPPPPPAPAPPVVKPDEPQDLGATVHDGDDLWILADPGTARPWYHVGKYDWRSWDEFPETVEKEET